jgi:hypothetical protein
MPYPSIQFKVGPIYVDVKQRRIPQGMNARLFWAQQHRWDKQWKASGESRHFGEQKELGPMPYEKARVLVTLFTMKLLDKDNAYASVKPIVDTLKILRR